MTRLALISLFAVLALPAGAQASPCKVGALPDHGCTPGLAATTDAHAVCPAARNLPVSAVLRRKVLKAYGIPKAKQARYVVAPLIPFALGGSNAQANLFPQSRANAAKLVKVGGALHQSVCDGEIALTDGQRIVASDWASAYAKFFG